MGKAKGPSEHQEQVMFVSWFRQQFRGVRIYAIPNGGERNRIVAAKLKREGVSPGVPDTHVPEWRLWVEMKNRDGGRLSDNQKDWIAYLESIGDTVLVCAGFREARRMVLEWKGMGL